MLILYKGIISTLIYALLLHHVASEGDATEPIDEGEDSDNIEFSLPSTDSSTDRSIISRARTVIFETTPGTQSISASIQEAEPVTEEEEHIKTSVYVSTFKPTSPEPSKENAPGATHAVWDSKGKICVLAKFHATFTIAYPTKDGDQSVSVELPNKVVTKGKCGDNTNSPVLRLLWDVFEFILTFSTISRDDEPDQWVMTGVELRYDTSPQLFDGAIHTRKIIAKGKDIELFKTEIGRSYYCPATKVIHLYNVNKNAVIVRMRDTELQPFDVIDGKFSKG